MQFKGMGQVLVVEGKPSQQVFWHRGDGGGGRAKSNSFSQVQVVSLVVAGPGWTVIRFVSLRKSMRHPRGKINGRNKTK